MVSRGGRQDRSWTLISGFRQSMSRRPVHTALARRLPTRDTGRAAAGRAGSSSSTPERTPTKQESLGQMGLSLLSAQF